MIRIVEDVTFDYRKPADKFLKKHEDIRDEFEESFMKLLKKDHPEQVNVKPLHGRFKGFSRIAIDGYRVIYRIDNNKIIIVDVAYAGSRGDIYKRFTGR